MDNYESDYSEDFEEEELVSSGAAPSSKPSASLARRQHQSHHQQQQQHQQQKQQQQQQQQQRQLREAGEEGGGGGGRGVEKRVEGVVRPREDEYGTPSRRKVPATISKSTGIIVKLCLVVCPYNRPQPFNSQARDRERKSEREEERACYNHCRCGEKGPCSRCETEQTHSYLPPTEVPASAERLQIRGEFSDAGSTTLGKEPYHLPPPEQALREGEEV